MCTNAKINSHFVWRKADPSICSIKSDVNFGGGWDSTRCRTCGRSYARCMCGLINVVECSLEGFEAVQHVGLSSGCRDIAEEEKPCGMN